MNRLEVTDVVDEDVHRAEFVLDCAKEVLHERRVGHVGGERLCIDAEFADVGGGLTGALVAGVVVDGHVRTAVGQRQCELTAQPAGGTGDKRDSAVEVGKQVHTGQTRAPKICVRDAVEPGIHYLH